jgi:hypothetical protein
MTKRPLVLYLDTSDISRFADLGTAREQQSAAETYAHLVQHLERGDIEVRFSCIHIAELGKSGSKELAHRKAAVIERLCDNLCFRPFQEIWKREVWSAIQSSVPGSRFAIPYAVRSDDGLWILDSADLRLNLDVAVKGALKDLPLNHAQRRALKARLLQRGRLTDFGLSLAKPHWASAGDEIARRFPVTDADDVVELFGSLLSGSINKQKFEKNFGRLLLRPTQMTRFIFEMDEVRKHCPAFVVGIGEGMVRMVSQLRAGLTSIPQFQRRDVVIHLADNLLRKPAVEAALRDRQRVRGAKLTDDRVEQIAYGATIGALPAIDLISKAAKVYATRHATMPRNPEASDGPDFMHLAYLPYCDVFRTDTYMAELLKQCGTLVTATVVRTLDELPKVIGRLTAGSAGSAAA